MKQQTLLAVAAVSCLAGSLFCYRATSWWTKNRLERRLKRGLRQEVRGERLLQQYGYRIESLQPEVGANLSIGGEEKRHTIRPDALAVKKGRRFLVEIKSGPVAGNPMFKDTRRQLLEYHYYSQEDGLLFVNADKGTIQEVLFPGRERIQKQSWFSLMTTAIIAGAAGYLIGRFT